VLSLAVLALTLAVGSATGQIGDANDNRLEPGSVRPLDNPLLGDATGSTSSMALGFLGLAPTPGAPSVADNPRLPDTRLVGQPEVGLPADTAGAGSVYVQGANPWGAFADGYRALLGRYPWDADTAEWIMMCESSGYADSVSPDGQNAGLFQINLIHGYSTEYLLVPENNVAVAYGIYQDQGWGPWACAP